MHEANGGVDGQVSAGEQTDPAPQSVEHDTSEHDQRETPKGPVQPFAILAQYQFVDQNLGGDRWRQRQAKPSNSMDSTATVIATMPDGGTITVTAPKSRLLAERVALSRKRVVTRAFSVTSCRMR